MGHLLFWVRMLLLRYYWVTSSATLLATSLLLPLGCCSVLGDPAATAQAVSIHHGHIRLPEFECLHGRVLCQRLPEELP